MSKFNKLPLALMLAASSTVLVGCGGSGQDEGEVATHQTIGGRAVDGYLARAKVFQDTNNNGRLDSWEPYAFTDDQGYYSYNPLTGDDYCATDATNSASRYCLRTASNSGTATIRVDGGYDVQTGEPFVGQLSRRISLEDDNANVLVSPLTTLVSSVESESDRNAVLNKLGLAQEDLDVDYLNADGANDVDERLYGLALKVHKTATVVSENIGAIYNELGSANNLPNDASAVTYRNLAHAYLDSASDGSDPLMNVLTLSSVTRQTELDVLEQYSQFNLIPPVSPISDDEASRLAQNAARVAQVVTQVVRFNASYTQSDAKGLASAIEVVTLRASGKQRASQQEIADTFDFFLQEENAANAQALITSLGSERADLGNVISTSFQYETSAEALAVLATVPQDAQPFANLAGMSLKVSDPDLGYAPDNLKDSEVELYFEGDYGVTSGDLTACVKYIDDASIDGTLGEANTKGELVSGTWSLLGANAANPSSYSVVLTIDFLGARYEAIIKSGGTEVVAGELQHKLRFDNNGDISTWLSPLGLQPVAHVPESNADCRERLPSRIGL
jgi:hypothetical protein